MERTSKPWFVLSQEDKDQRLKKIGEAIKFYDLETLSIKQNLKQIYRFTLGELNTEVDTISITGRVSISKREKAEKFEKIIKEDVLKDLIEFSVQIDIDFAPIGEPMIPIKNVKEIRTGEDISIDHKPGQVILIDFCHLCPLFLSGYQWMEETFKMLQNCENCAEKWGDKVRIISIYDTAEKAVKLVDEKGWTKVELYLEASSKCSDDYAARGVPVVALVDTNGQVAFIGDPMSAYLEKSIESLLSGGDVIRVKSEASTEAGDPANIKEEILKFSTEVGEKIKTNEVLKNCKLDAAGYMVAVNYSTYDIHTNTMVTDLFRIVTFLKGPKTEIVPARAEIEKILAEFTLEKIWDMQPMD